MTGVALSRLFQNDPLVLVPIPFIIAVFVGIVFALKLLGKQSLAEKLAALLGHAGPWVAELGRISA